MTEPTPQKSRQRKAAALLWAGGIAAVFFLLLAAIATPKFVSFQCRSKQSEAKGNLKALFVAEEAFFSKNGAYSDDFTAIGFNARGGNRYVFGLMTMAGGHSFKVNNPSSQLAAQLATYNVSALLAGTTAGPSGFKAFAVGNIDSDDTLDFWAISEKNQLTNATSDCAE